MELPGCLLGAQHRVDSRMGDLERQGNPTEAKWNHLITIRLGGDRVHPGILQVDLATDLLQLGA
jgi:hypothetical protein